MFEDTKGVIRIRISKKNRKHNDQRKKVQKDKQRSTTHTYKTKDRVTRINGSNLTHSNMTNKDEIQLTNKHNLPDNTNSYTSKHQNRDIQYDIIFSLKYDTD